MSTSLQLEYVDWEQHSNGEWKYLTRLEQCLANAILPDGAWDLQWTIERRYPRWLWLSNYPGSPMQQFLFSSRPSGY